MMKRTPLYETHRALGARMIEFAGWEMPVQYTGILAEHQAVRTRAGLFDLSHMGEIEVAGRGALEVCQELLVTNVALARLGQAQYSVLCYPEGGIVDDVIGYCVAEDRYLFCVNAANVAKDFDWMVTHNRGRADVMNRSDEYALIAVQGPRACAILQRLTTLDLTQVRRYWFVTGEVAGVSALVARTGYTGEDGFELFVPAQCGTAVWTACLDAGRNEGIVAVGLGARDTLRLEAGYLLYGNDIDAHTTPLEAGLQRLVKFDKEKFLGREALLRQQATGISQQLIGLKMEDPGIPRHGYGLWHEERPVGRVTSGTQSPSLGVGIALGYVPPTCATVGTELAVEVRGRHARARVVARPFFRRT
ncbi:MAG TPA: glycine cleavage system aminomethyltransferase GcvT [Candidatus Binatia bacterium]|nr:glycine cleavage system aminomethyltransferase GcvT [Candidatus Binatia bacterium]